MAEGKYVLPTDDGITLSGTDADRLISLSSGDAALLYIYILRCRGTFDAAAACRALSRSRSSIDAAAAQLIRAGLIERSESPAEEIPEYTAEDIKTELDSGTAFKTLVEEVQSAMGRPLSSGDLIKLFGIYSDLHLPPEVILLLVCKCVGDMRSRFGPGRLPTMRNIEKNAFIWEREGVRTIDDAERYIRKTEQSRSFAGKIKALLGLPDRALTPSEAKYAAAWESMDLTDEVILMAYDRTVMNTGRLSWGYMNSILQSWNEKGLKSPSDIEKGDKKPAKRNGDVITPPGIKDLGGELERIKRLTREMKDTGK